MLRYNNQLLFPTLKYIPIDPIPKSRDFQQNIYQLDWARVDSIKKERWLKTHQVTSDQPFPGTLPKEYLSWTDDMFFAIPQGLLDEIRHCSLKAMEEWSRRKPEIRWEPIPSQTPVSSYVYKAFHLIADCLYDPKANGFSRDQKKILIPYALCYRFWCFQMDPDKMHVYTGLIDLKACFENKKFDPLINLYYDFIGSLEVHNTSLMIMKEEASSKKIIPNATLKEVLEKKRSSAFANATTMTVPDLGHIDLINVKFEQMQSPDFKLTAEIANYGEIRLGDIKVASTPLAFKISDGSGQLLIDSSEILSVSGNPPPIITLRVYHCIWDKTGTFVKRHNMKVVEDHGDWRGDVTTSVKRVDKNRIKKVRDEDLNALDDFKEIDMKPTNPLYNSVCLRPKNHK